MFLRYDITDGRDRLAALNAARKFVGQQPHKSQRLENVDAPGRQPVGLQDPLIGISFTRG